ncbi:hypothetical protein [Marinobacter lutaoensis]|uniref:hypothetical protein n=1 Tax=Marinobacter lutaoensis TaxID=135739 RepID=UPI0015948FE1|nr:hypothetical protein [Marinobacter lutaoensis]NVD36826.1 hypothetical protein [Marinobacter lutaoensis]
MTEVEQLREEIEKLKAKNGQLLDEKRKVKAANESAMEELEQIRKERDEAKAELHRLTVELPRQNMLEEIAMPEMAETLFREITHHYDIGEGDALIDKATGEALQIEIPDKGERVPVKLDHEGIKRIAESKLIPSIRAMIKGSGATGGGATGGGTSTAATQTSKPAGQPQPTRRFGLS